MIVGDCFSYVRQVMPAMTGEQIVDVFCYAVDVTAGEMKLSCCPWDSKRVHVSRTVSYIFFLVSHTLAFYTRLDWPNIQ